MLLPIVNFCNLLHNYTVGNFFIHFLKRLSKSTLDQKNFIECFMNLLIY